VACLTLFVLVLIGCVTKQEHRLNQHHDIMKKNLDLIESLDRSLEFTHGDIKLLGANLRDEIKDAQYEESTRIYEVILANAKGLQDQIKENTKLIMERSNQSNILIENRTALLDWDLRRHELQNVVRDLIDYLELDWQLQQQDEKTIFSKREGKKKKS
jgi:hypothetical protein